MARSAIIYRAHLELSHVDRDVYGEYPLTVARHPSETLERTVMRILAFALRANEGLEFGRGVSATDEPDLWRREGDGRVRDWIEVGLPDAKRLTKASRQSGRCDLFAFGDGAERWRKAQLDAMKVPENLGVARIADEFVAALTATVDRQIRWCITVADGTVFLTSTAAGSDASFETVPEVWVGDPLG